MNDERNDNYYLNLTRPEQTPSEQATPASYWPDQAEPDEVIAGSQQASSASCLPNQTAPGEVIADSQQTPSEQTSSAFDLPYQTAPDEIIAGSPLLPLAEEDRQQKRRRRAGGKKFFAGGISLGALAAVLVCCVLISSTVGAAFGLIAGRNSVNVPRPGQPMVSRETAPRFGEAVSEQGGRMASISELYATTRAGQALTPAQVAAIAADSVVEIVTETEVEVFNFWGRGNSTRTVPGAGSGVIISADGYIITNNHVIENANKIEVTLRNGENYSATLVATDSETDVAVIKIAANGLTAAIIGDSDALVVGEPAMVIGNPLGRLGGTVTSGIISALDRPISFREDDGSTKTMNLLQTDAAINSGNSGGGLFNQYGELVGVVVAKSAGVGVEGLGFAIPVNDVRGVIDDLISYGYARGRLMLGVSLINIDSEQAMNYYRVDEQGIYIYSVEEGSNAERAGLQSGDRLISVNGQRLSDGSEVSEIVQTLSVGDTLKITYKRDSAEHTVDIVMQETVPASLTPSKTNG